MLTLFFIGLTIFLIIKLNEVIGVSIGHDFSNEEKELFSKRFSAQEFIDINKAQTIEEKVSFIQNKLSDFDPADFKAKAKKVFEMIFKAYSNSDKEVLKSLLTANMYKAFDMAIEDRKSKNQILSGSLEGINSIEILNIDADSKTVSIHVKFDTEQINLIKDKSGNIIEGDPEFVDNIKETWVFQREFGSHDKRWFLSEIIAN